jgi:hypothetical protein
MTQMGPGFLVNKRGAGLIECAYDLVREGGFQN